MPKCCRKSISCHLDDPCTDLCSSPLCGDPNLLAVYAPVVYDEIGINICQTLTVDGTTFPTLTTAEKAFVQVLNIDFTNSEITPISGRPNCTEITLQNIAVTLLIRSTAALASCSAPLSNHLPICLRLRTRATMRIPIPAPSRWNFSLLMAFPIRWIRPELQLHHSFPIWDLPLLIIP